MRLVGELPADLEPDASAGNDSREPEEAPTDGASSRAVPDFGQGARANESENDFMGRLAQETAQTGRRRRGHAPGRDEGRDPDGLQIGPARQQRSRSGGRERPQRMQSRGRERPQRSQENAALEEDDGVPALPARPRRMTRAERELQASETAVRDALASLDGLDLALVMRARVYTLQNVPGRLRGVLKFALRRGLEHIKDMQRSRAEGVSRSRGWKLFLLASRMLLHRQKGITRLTRDELDLRVRMFCAGEWLQLLEKAHAAAQVVEEGQAERRDDLEARAARAAALAHLGELSAASQALTAEPLAAGDENTLRELRDRARRPGAAAAAEAAAAASAAGASVADIAAAAVAAAQEERAPIPEQVMDFAPRERVSLSWGRFLANLRGARRGSAAGPSGSTNEHLRVLLDDEACLEALFFAGNLLANADVPPDVLAGLKTGRMVALRKRNGGVRALVMSDVFRRLVGRTLAQQFGEAFLDACMPFQFALGTRAGTEALARAIRAATEWNPRATVLSIDGVGAFDHVRRRAMLSGLYDNPALQGVLPYARAFYSMPSTYTWTDDHGVVHEICQAEGGEQGDPLMPALFSVALHAALQDVQQSLLEGESAFAFLDDIYVISMPDRLRAIFDVVRDRLWHHAGIEVHFGKTKAWNAAGEEPENISSLQTPEEAQRDPIWVGSWAMPEERQGLIVLGTPIGREEFVRRELREKRLEHDRLLERIPALPSLQSAWLLLLMCASPRPNYLLRVLPPSQTEEFAASHDSAASACLRTLLGTEAPAHMSSLQQLQAQLPLRLGGLGLRSARRVRFAAHWASWADCLPVLRARLPGVAAQMLAQLQNPDAPGTLPCIRDADMSARILRADGFAAPTWEQLFEGLRPEQPEEREMGELTRGWQREASMTRDLSDLETHFSTLDTASRALLLSQAGPHGGRAFTVLPTAPEFTFPDSHMRVLLLRRLRMQLHAGPNRCRCRRRMDPYGDHRAACANAGVLRPRGVPLEHAAARVCREAGARVARNVPLANMNIDVPVGDARQIEVVANGLPLWHGAQMAVDTTLVCPVRRDGQPRRHGDSRPGVALETAARTKRELTYPELLAARRCRLVVLGFEVGGRWSDESLDFVRRLARAKARSQPDWLRASAAQAYAHRWSGMLAVAAQRAFAASLLELPLANESCWDGEAPACHDVVADARWAFPVPNSRLGLLGFACAPVRGAASSCCWASLTGRVKRYPATNKKHNCAPLAVLSAFSAQRSKGKILGCPRMFAW